ncbi:helix-turn-helix transcriptional regulator [Actinokineospora sp. HUAS TT18]|uniref:helix-turn-helix transcriptional regulator n=1 Tax=Actinokineospora sp. HUAS TT18 TaxID=3447451 RepID=UPI003F51F930
MLSAEIKVALALPGGTLRDKIDGLLDQLDWVRRCATRDPTAGVVFVDARDASAAPAGGVRVVAVLAEPAALGQAIHAGAHGVVLADDPDEDIGRAVHDVVRHGGWVSPRLAGPLLGLVPAAAPADPVDLTAREREALRLLADGMENADIAAAMFISVSAVKYHVSNILRKFDCRDRTQLVARVNRSGKTWSRD